MSAVALLAASAVIRAEKAERVAAGWTAYAAAMDAWYFNRDTRPERERELWARVDEARERLRAEGVDVRKALEEAST